MADGTRRSNTPHIWPTQIELPDPAVSVAYLDLNHWVGLAKAFVGHSDGRRFEATLAACIAAADEGSAVFPVSDSLFFEMSKLYRHRQRRDLRLVIERLSGFKCIMGRTEVSMLEIEAMLDEVAGPAHSTFGSVPYLGNGIATAMGVVGGFKVRNESGEDVTASVADEFPGGAAEFMNLLESAELELNRKVIEGPSSPSEEAELRERGWRPYPHEESSAKRLQQEVDQVSVFNANPKWRRGRIRDVIAAREVLIEINELLFDGMKRRGATLETVVDSVEAWRRACDSMPSFDVAVTLKAAYHRNPEHRWTTNDIHDIDALASTVPYCDVVATDKAAANTLSQSGCLRRFNTVVTAELRDVPALLSATKR